MDGGEEHDPNPPAGPPAQAWVHPAQLGHHHRRVRADRRRSRVLAAGLVASGVAVLIVSARLPNGDAAVVRSASPPPMARGVVGVEALDLDGATLPGLVLDTRGHVLVPLHHLDPDGTLRVHCGDRIAEATVVATDPTGDYAVVSIPTTAGTTPLEVAPMGVHDTLTLTTFAPDGERRAAQVRVVPGGPGIWAVDGVAGHRDGVLTTADGRLVGWVLTTTDSTADTADGEAPRPVPAVAAGPLLASARRLLADAATPRNSWLPVLDATG